MLNRTALEQMLQNDRRNRLFRLCKDLNVALERRGAELEGVAKPPSGPAIGVSQSAGGIIVVEFGIVKTAEENRKIIAKAKTYERLGEATKKIMARTASSPMCRQLGDADLHERDVGSVIGTFKSIFGSFETGAAGALEPESFEKYVRSEVSLSSLYMALFVEMRHALLISEALGMRLGKEVRDAAGSGLFEIFERTLQNERCMEIVDALREKGEERLASMLLNVLYTGADAKRRLRLVWEGEVSMAPVSRPVEKKVETQVPKPVDGLAEKVKELIDADEYELEAYRNEFGGDAEKIAKAISISRAGASKKLSLFAVERSMDEKELSFMIDAEEMICGSWAECPEVFRALGGLSRENREILLGGREALEKAAGWLALMPNYIRVSPALGFLLGLHFEAPEDKASAHSFLMEHKAELDGAMLLNDGNLEGIESDSVSFIAYLEGFVKPGKKEEEPAAAEAPKPVKQARPYESLVFSKETEEAMMAEGTDPLDVKITLVCGLRLNSAKGARGKTYFNTAVFRRNADRDLKEERKRIGENGGRKMPIDGRREAAERFLTRHGVLSFYKSRDEVVRLNIGDCGTHSDGLGDAVIADTVRWMREFQKETAR